MHIKQPALKENSSDMKVSVDPSNPIGHDGVCVDPE